MNEITTKWEPTGLLDGLDECQKNECAEILNKAAKIIVETAPAATDTKEYNKHDCFCGWVLPVIRNIYEDLQTKKFPDVNWFMKDAMEFFQKKQDLFESLKESSYIALDAEAQFGELYKKDFIERYENTGN